MDNFSSKIVRTTLRIHEDLKEKLDDMAEKQNRSFNNLIVTILQDYIRKLDRDK